MALDFLVLRHLRVARARVMRRIHNVSARDRSPVRTTYGVRMVPEWSDKTFAYCYYGTYGPYLADLIEAIDRPFVFLDVGANQGLFSLLAARNPHCRRAVALEPVAATYQALCANIAANRLEDRVVAVQCALSDRTGSGTMTVSASHSGVATLGGHLADASGERSEPVRLTRLDDLDPSLFSGLPIFAKVDVEGHETVALHELTGSAQADRLMAVFFELDERWTDAEAVLDRLRGAGLDEFHTYGRGRHYDVLASRRTPAATAGRSA
ncbi:FkbM family methyltransferase [Rubrivirga sp. S365]|uniref:FkbM family methyltransferase n=1 Tax=Rubrivirga litoralis TaxID=3075598 RepID=A0ABU3BVB8_9BACT|nr:MULTISPECIES: FkbM family methyltransferase [unclassified Rubrivirga]MDT0633243.1 FkbM family methyltransferase [Rubrivirga sp. F394]MDT7857809.1 FkbM family methyltransferase [Rubrivirga sp. S365]